MSDNFVTKKSVWKETVENNEVLFILPGIIALLGFWHAIRLAAYFHTFSNSNNEQCKNRF